jgi:DMSO/TMAO reductase YedYZ molybdopterin-dependent catalytic subunit
MTNHDSSRNFRLTSFWAVTGLISAGTGLAVGEVLSARIPKMLSPIIGVGNRSIDLAPPRVKRFAIATFGTHDKQALLIGMAATIAIFSAVVGVIARKRLRVSIAALFMFGALGGLAAVTGRQGGVQAAVPSIVTAIVASLILVVVARLARSSVAAPVVDQTNSDSGTAETSCAKIVSRRTVLAAGTFAAFGVGMGGYARQLTAAADAAVRKAVRVLPRARKPLAVLPVSAGVPELLDANPFITPNKNFYRIDTALVVPKVDVNTWKLKITGMVGKERTYTYDELLERALVERDITLTCVSNEVGGILMGNARWLGVPLQELLDEAEVDPAATQIMGRSVDGWSAGFPTAALQAATNAIVALGMNGEPLPFEHGYPARLVIPGIYGYASATKWLDTIELTTLEASEGYWVPRGYAKEAPIKLASRIDVPRGLSTIAPGRTAIAGVAWSQTIGISKVEVKIDAGDWQEAELADEVGVDTWRQWRMAWDATTGQHDIAVRAYDSDGKLQQETRVAPLPNGATGWHQVLVFVS